MGGEGFSCPLPFLSAIETSGPKPSIMIISKLGSLVASSGGLEPDDASGGVQEEQRMSERMD